MPLDPQAQHHLQQREALGLPPVEELSPPEARARVEADTDALFGEKEQVGSVTDSEVQGVRVRSYVSLAKQGDGADLPILVFFHGGGWVVGSLDAYDGVCRALANRVPSRVVSVDYRLAPEHRFPAAVEDCWAVTRWAFGQAASVAVAGDSAGGNLAAVIALRAKEAGLTLAYQLLIYPVTDHDFGTPSYSFNASGFGLTRAGMRWYWNHYLGGADGSHPEASPLRASDLAGVAPALVVVCEFDPLRDEGVAYAQRLQEVGVLTRLSEYPGMIHGFLRMAAVIDRTQALLDESAAALRQAFGGRPPQ
jgi:acetyl esterase